MTGGEPAGRRRVLAVIVLVGALLRVALGAERPIWIDEAYRLVWSHGCRQLDFYDVRSSDLCINQPPRKLADVLRGIAPFEPPLTAVLLNRWMRATGAAADLPIRVPLITLGVLAIVGFYLLGADLYGVRTGVVAALLLALSPFHVYFAEEINNYALGACCTVFSYLFYFRMLRGRRTRDAAAYVVCTGAALLTHYYTLIVFLSQAAGLLVWYGRRFRALVRGAMPLAVVAAGFGLYLPVLVRQLPYMLSMKSGVFGGVRYLAERLLANLSYPWLGELGNRIPTLVAGVIVAVTLGLWGVGLRALSDGRLRAVLALNALLPTAIVSAAYLVRKSNQILWPRYGLFFTFALLLPIAHVWAEPAWRARHALTAAVAGVLLAAGLGFLFGGQYQRQWRHAAEIIARDGGPDEGVILFQPNMALGRYLDPGKRMFGVGDHATLPLQVTPATDGQASMWALFAWHEDSPEVTEAVSRMLACKYPLRDDYPLYLIRLSRYHAGSPRSPATQETHCGPANALVADGGECVIEPGAEAPVVRGWIDAPPGTDGIDVLVDGRPFAAVASVPIRPAASRVSFAQRLAADGEPDGSLLAITLGVRLADGRNETARDSLLCVKRSRIAMDGTGAPPDVRGWLSSPTKEKRFHQGERMEANGWVFATRGIRELVYLVDGQEVLRSRQHGFSRPDVAQAFPELDAALATHSGFVALIDTSGLKPGPHVLTAACVHPDGSTSPFPPERRFGGPPLGAGARVCSGAVSRPMSSTPNSPGRRRRRRSR